MTLAYSAALAAWVAGQLVAPLGARPGGRLSTVTALQTGEVLFTGGSDPTSQVTTAQVWRFDPLTGRFTAAEALPQPNDTHSAVRLASGDVLLAGGTVDAGTAVYDVHSGHWLDAGALPGGPRLDAQLVRLPDGRALFIGGRPRGGPPILAPARSVDIFDPATRHWSSGPPLAAGSDRACSLVLEDGGVLLLAGGSDSTFVTSAWYRLDALTVVGGGRLADGRSDETCVRWPDDTVTLFGGQVDAGTAAPNLDELDVRTGVSSFGPSMLEPAMDFAFGQLPSGHLVLAGGALLPDSPVRIYSRDAGFAHFDVGANLSLGSAVVLPTGRMLLCGGYDGKGVIVDERRAAVSSVPPPPTTTQGAAIVRVPDGRLLSIGGQTGAGLAATVSLYQEGSAAWAPGGQLAVARASAAATVLFDGRVMVLGGERDAGAVDAVELFDPASGTVIDGGRLAKPRSAPLALTLGDGRVLILGGGWPAEIYDPRSGSSALLDPPLAPCDRCAAALLADGRVLVAGGTLDVAAFWQLDAGMVSQHAFDAGVRRDPSLVVLPGGRAVLLAGGSSSTQPLDDAYQLDVVAGTWSALPRLPSPTTQAQPVVLRSGEVLLARGASGSLLFTFDPLRSAWQSFDGQSSATQTGARRLVSGAVLMPGGLRYTEDGPAGLPVPSAVPLTASAAPGETIGFAGAALLAPSRTGGATTEMTSWDEVVFALASLEGQRMQFIESHAQSDQQATATIPADTPPGWYDVWPVVHGVMGDAHPLFIGLPSGAACTWSPQCASRSCMSGACTLTAPDGGTADAGAPDAGPNDGPTPTMPARFEVACGCGATSGSGLMALLATVALGRRMHGRHRSRRR